MLCESRLNSLTTLALEDKIVYTRECIWVQSLYRQLVSPNWWYPDVTRLRNVTQYLTRIAGVIFEYDCTYR